MKYNIFSKNNDKYLIGDIEWGGFGAMYARRKLIMQIAHAFDRIPVFRFTSYLYDDPFEEFNINLNTIKKMGINEIEKFDFTENDKPVVFFDFGSYWNSKNMKKYQCWHPKETDYLMYSGYMYDLLKIKKSYKNDIGEKIDFIKEKYEIKGFGDCTALHLRRGDKIVESPYLKDDFLFDYVEKQNLGKKFFVTSDDLEYIHEIESKYPQYEFIYDSDEKRYGGSNLSNVDMVARDPSLKEQESLTFMKNIEILKQCKAVVGSYSTQMTKIAGSLSSYDKGKNVLHLINPSNNEIDFMGSSEQTS
jgi:hypothetical protein